MGFCRGTVLGLTDTYIYSFLIYKEGWGATFLKAG